MELVVEDGFPSRVSGRTGQELTRIVQEALTNVRRHAGAGHVTVKLGIEGDIAFAEVADDGRGFATENPKIGIGRHSMHQRAVQMGGELEIESEPGEGTVAGPYLLPGPGVANTPCGGRVHPATITSPYGLN